MGTCGDVAVVANTVVLTPAALGMGCVGGAGGPEGGKPPTNGWPMATAAWKEGRPVRKRGRGRRRGEKGSRGEGME
jgi:hypothetical protein